MKAAFALSILCLLSIDNVYGQIKFDKLLKDTIEILAGQKNKDQTKEQKWGMNNNQSIPELDIITDPSNEYPTLIFHGFNDHCQSDQVRLLVELIQNKVQIPSKTDQNQYEPVYAECIEFGIFPEPQSMFTEFNTQIEHYCQKVKEHPVFSKGNFNLIGLSQGSLVARHIIQSCDIGENKVHKYISVGGPLMGTHRHPECNLDEKFCQVLAQIESNLIYMGFIQDFLAPASYWRNPQDSDLFNWYLSDSRYLPFINNEKHHSNSDMFKKRFSSLDDVLLLKFEDDKTIYPSCSSHFQEIDSNGQIIKFEETDFYKNDAIGVKTLNEQGKIHLATIKKAHHLYIEPEVMKHSLIPFLYSKDQSFSKNLIKDKVYYIF